MDDPQERPDESESEPGGGGQGATANRVKWALVLVVIIGGGAYLYREMSATNRSIEDAAETVSRHGNPAAERPPPVIKPQGTRVDWPAFTNTPMPEAAGPVEDNRLKTLWAKASADRLGSEDDERSIRKVAGAHAGNDKLKIHEIRWVSPDAAMARVSVPTEGPSGFGPFAMYLMYAVEREGDSWKVVVRYLWTGRSGTPVG